MSKKLCLLCSYVRGIDVELSPDADSPRPCGLALLLCMLERGDRQVAQALLAMAHQLQVTSSSQANICNDLHDVMSNQASSIQHGLPGFKGLATTGHGCCS